MWSLMIAGLVVCYRLAGFEFKLKTLSLFWEQFFKSMPIAIFAALVMSALLKNGSSLNVKLIALLCAGVIAKATRQVGLGVLVGLGILWLLTHLTQNLTP